MPTDSVGWRFGEQKTAICLWTLSIKLAFFEKYVIVLLIINHALLLVISSLKKGIRLLKQSRSRDLAEKRRIYL